MLTRLHRAWSLSAKDAELSTELNMIQTQRQPKRVRGIKRGGHFPHKDQFHFLSPFSCAVTRQGEDTCLARTAEHLTMSHKLV